MPLPANKSLLINNSTGQTLEIFAFSEGVFLRNEVSDDPINVLSLQSLVGNPLASAMKFLPAVVHVTGLLTAPPEEIGAVEAYGDLTGLRPVHLYERGRKFANEVTTFSYVTPNYPGAVFDDLVIEAFEFVADNTYQNAYSIQLNMKSVMWVMELFGIQLGSSETAQWVGRGLQVIHRNVPFPLNLVAAGGLLLSGAVYGFGETMLDLLTLGRYSRQKELIKELMPEKEQQKRREEATKQRKDRKRARGVGAANVQKGSIPWQTWQHRIGGKLFNFELWWEPTYKYPLLTLLDEWRSPIVVGRPLLLYNDVLQERQYDERVAGLHIIPMATSPKIDRITEDNLQEQVFLMLFLDEDSEMYQAHLRGETV